ncbi:hypothetical protein H0H93_011722 [Arthromyces matolae]|nr:hypothetical protein H0H93_011722 [Arthromyces matolae]
MTVGSAAGSIQELFSRIKTIDEKHGKFDLVLCIGDFFGVKDGDNNDETDKLLAGELEDSGKSGIITTAHGLRIACLGGIHDEDVFYNAESAPGFMSPFFSSQTLERLLSNSLSKTASARQNFKSLAAIQSSMSSSQLVDIFLTNVWPSAITQLTTSPPGPSISSSVAELDEVVRQIKPRYHFASGRGSPPQFWEREPYVWDDEEGRVSRFISLGAFGGEGREGKKPRWFYAFSITPKMGQVPRPTNVTHNPFTQITSRPEKRSHEKVEDTNFIFGNVRPPAKRTRLGLSQICIHRRNDLIPFKAQGEPGKPPPGYKCRRCDSTEPGHFVRDCPTRDERGDTGGKKPKPGYVCRACGSELHLLEDCLVANQRLIVPITHCPTYTTLPVDVAGPILDETERFKSSLQAYYAKHGAVGVTFEIGRLSAKGGHAHVQSVPIPLKLKDKVEETFIREGRQFGIDFEEDADSALESCAEGKGSYFRVDLPDGRKMVHLIKDQVPFSIQFGRQVLVNLLDVPERFDWKACMLPEDEDRADAQDFKTGFAPFDPST